MPNSDQNTLLEKFKSFPPADKKKIEEEKDEIKKLLTTTVIDFQDDQGLTLLHYAVHPKRQELLASILEDKDFDNIKDYKTNLGNTAIQGAALFHGNLKAFKKLHEEGANYSKKDFYKELKEKIKKEVNKNKKAIFIKIAEFIYNVTPKKMNTDTPKEYWGIYAYPAPDSQSKQLIQEKEFKKQKQVTERFFWVRRDLQNGNSSTKLYGEINGGMVGNWPVDLDGYSARSAVIAVSKILRDNMLFPTVTFKIGETKLECSPAVEASRARQVGNFVVNIIQLNSAPPYRAEIMNYLTPLVSNPQSIKRNKKLAFLFRRKGNKIASFEENEFNQRGQVKLADEDSYDSNKEQANQKNGQRPVKNKIKEAIHVLNFLNFMHTIGEVVRRLYRDVNGDLFDYESKEHKEKYFKNPKTGTSYYGPVLQQRSTQLKLAKPSDEFPVASFHARAFLLMSKGRNGFTMNDIYGTAAGTVNAPKHGVVAAKETIEDIKRQCKPKGDLINQAMSEYHAIEYKKDYPNHYLMTRPFWIKSELYGQFGGKSESENSYDDLSSDNSDYLSENTP